MLTPEGQMAFDATFEVYPEVEIGDLSAAEIESASAEVLAAARKLDGSQLVQLMIDCGLFERLRDRPAS